MVFSLALPDEICAELRARARARRVLLNVSVEEMAQRIGVSAQLIAAATVDVIARAIAANRQRLL
jgi:DNA-binding XRE family transcriptional regulator